MKIIKIGTFDKEGAPTGWCIDCEGMPLESNVGYILGVIDEKVIVCGVEMVEWTAERLRIMEAI